MTNRERRVLPDGYTDIAPGKIASVVTYLEMLQRPALVSSTAARRDVQLRHVQNPELDWYRAIFRRAGAQWLWFSRLEMTDAQLSAALHNSNIEFFTAECEASQIGMAELDRSQPPNVEITSFALFSESIGQGLGHPFMAQLLDRAWTPATKRVWLHTCNLDGPAALNFYIKCGFRPYKRAIEVADDPRLRGILPEDAAPQVPIIR